MIFTDLIDETKFSLSANKSRSALTILGIVIGISSVIAMIAVGQGTTANITNSIESLGTNLLIVMPGSQRGGGGNIVRGGMGSASTLKLDDAQAIRDGVAGINNIASVASSRKQVTAKGTNTNTNIVGTEANYFQIKTIEAELGSLFSATQANSRVAVLGPITRNDLFGADSNPIGQKVRIGGQEFTIIGITKSKGGTGTDNSDDLIYIPISVAQQYFTGNKSVNSINIEAIDEKQMATIQLEITDLLLTRHKISDSANADFNIMNQADMLATMSSVSATMTWLLGAIAGISLLVGGIGIMNMMLTTVTERTREIGLRKSLGAKNSDISNQFLAESIALTFIGGIIGIVVGYLASVVISRLGNMVTIVSFNSVLLAVGISALIGVIFGYYPAKRAARLNPIDALRYQ